MFSQMDVFSQMDNQLSWPAQPHRRFSVRLATIVLSACFSFSFVQAAMASTCFGTTSNGALAGGCKIASDGENFSAYTRLGSFLGRTWVHCTVATVISQSYGSLAKSHPQWHFVYGESGLAEGGQFDPHKTHQNGLSVDFMVPVLNESGESVPLPTGITNKFGYSIEFDSAGSYNGLTIDFVALAAHIAAVKKAAAANGIGIWRVIFDPKLQPLLHSTPSWPLIRDLQFSTRPSWVRHDEHYHIDFEIPCKPMSKWPG